MRAEEFGRPVRGLRVTFRTLDLAVFLAIGCALSSCGLNMAHAVRSPRGEGEKGSAPKRPLYEPGLLGVRVEDVQHILSEDKGKSDAEVARQLSGLGLTERMSSARLKLLEQSMPGLKSRWSLIALADASAFLRPAAADVLPLASPDLDEQRRMIAMTVDYLGKTLPKLPNFSATEAIIRFDDDAGGHKHPRKRPRWNSAWHRVSSSQVIVTYRDGKEVVDPREWGRHPSHPEGEGLVTRGTFGPILSTVIVDAAHGETTWDHWERGNTGTLAVFRYRVPENQSHYAVAFHGLSLGSGNADGDPPMGYHGEMAIDPATGTILRLIVQADPPLGSPIQRGDILVEYGPVEIGGKTYTCPIRSVSVSLEGMEFLGGATNPFGGFAPTGEAAQFLNDLTFEGYHLFRSESRILTGDVPDH